MLLDKTLAFLRETNGFSVQLASQSKRVHLFFDSTISISSIQSLNDYGPAQKEANAKY